jgi:hypothetical protein
MRIIILSVRMAGLIATLAAVLVWLIAVEGANAKGQARGNSGANANHIQNTIRAGVAKNEHGHRHHRHAFMVGALPERPVYCNCSYESCPEWILVQCVGYRPRHMAARPVEVVPRCICSNFDLTDPNYD